MSENVSNIVNFSILHLIQFFKNYDFNSETQFIIQANEYNCGIIIDNFTLQQTTLFDDIHKYFNVVYFVVNKTIIINKKFIDIIEKQIIFRQFCTFHQTDDNIKLVIHNILSKQKYQDLILLGGEMYIFSKILTYDTLLCYSDFQSIVEDTKFNLDKYDNIFLVDYSNFSFDIKDTDSQLIANTGKSGMGICICNNIIKNKIKKLIVISCNEKSFEKDCKIIGKYYKLQEKIIINYVSINFLVINNSNNECSIE